MAEYNYQPTEQERLLQLQMEQEKLRFAQEKEKMQLMRQQGFNPDGTPIAPEFQTVLNPDGTLPDQYKLNPTLINPDELQGYNMLKQLATQTGDSQWAQYAKQQNDLNRQDQIDAVSRQGAGARNQAYNELATRGGLSSGARERIAAGGADNALMAKQGAYRQSGNNLLDILKQDQDYKRDAMLKFGEAEGKLAIGNNSLTNQAQEFNLNNVLKEKDMQRDWTMDTYKTQLDKWAAGKQADATRRSGGGGK